MVTLTFNIPLYRLKLSIAQKRGGRRDKLLEILGELVKVRIGSRISRLVRLMLERVHLNRLFGANLIGIFLVTNTLIPGASALSSAEAEVVSISAGEAPVVTIVNRRYPVDHPVITQGYHFFHAGIDIDGVTGDTIHPIMNGRVESVGQEFFLGKTVVVEHENDVKSVYAHLNKINVKPGEEVTTSSKIGEMGNTGRSFGDHLHLEVYKNGRNVSPHTVLPPVK